METVKWVIMVLDNLQMSGVEIYRAVKSPVRIFEVEWRLWSIMKDVRKYR